MMATRTDSDLVQYTIKRANQTAPAAEELRRDETLKPLNRAASPQSATDDRICRHEVCVLVIPTGGSLYHRQGRWVNPALQMPWDMAPSPESPRSFPLPLQGG